MLSAWTNPDTVTLACRLIIVGLSLQAFTIIGMWVLERWSGD